MGWFGLGCVGVSCGGLAWAGLDWAGIGWVEVKRVGVGWAWVGMGQGCGRNEQSEIMDLQHIDSVVNEFCSLHIYEMADENE